MSVGPALTVSVGASSPSAPHRSSSDGTPGVVSSADFHGGASGDSSWSSQRVVILAVDEADHQVKKAATQQQRSNNNLSHGESLFHLPSSSSMPTASEVTDNEFSLDHIDAVTLRFKHVEPPPKSHTATKYHPHQHQPHAIDQQNIDRTLEDGFLADFFDRYWQRVQKAILTAVIIWALYFYNDYDKNRDGLRKNYEETIIIRFANCGLGLICAGALSTPFIQKRKLLMPVVGLAMITFGVAQIIFGMWDENELDPAYSVIMILIPSTSSTLFKQRYIFTVFFQAALLLLYILITYFFDSFHAASDLILTALGLFFANCIFAVHAYRREWKMRKDYLMKCQLEREEERSQNLLLRMLPASVIAKLREGSEFIYYKHPSVTLLFSHISSFDDHVHSMTAMQVIRMLNALFTQFDTLTDIHGVYKVETIGDVYLVAAGCPIEYVRADHVEAVASFALDLVEATKQFMVEHVRDVKSGSSEFNDPTSKHHGYRKKHGGGHVSKLSPIQLQCGINSGPIIAGVVGHHYPRLRLMGDTINTASRMSTTALADQIQMTNKSWDLLNKKWFETKYRGEITVKGKGSMKTYLLVRRIELLCPPPKSLEQVQRENGTIKLDAFKTNDDQPAETHGGILVGAHSSRAKGGAHHPHHSGSSTDVLIPVGAAASTGAVVEMLPTELPGVPEMLEKLRSGEVGESRNERSTSSLFDGVAKEDRARDHSTTPSSMKELEDGLGDVLHDAGGDGDIVQLVDPDGQTRTHHVIKAAGHSPAPSPKASARALGPTPTPGLQPPSPAAGAKNRRKSVIAKTGSTVSSTAGPLSERSAGSGTDKEHSNSHSSSNSLSNTKLIITASAQKNTLKSTRLFSFGPMNAILRPDRKWYTSLSQIFITDPMLEYEFQYVYAKDYLTINRVVVNAMWIFLLPLSMYEVINNQSYFTHDNCKFEIDPNCHPQYDELEASTVFYCWLTRIPAIAAGTCFFYYSRRKEYLMRMQLISGVTLSIVGSVFIATTTLTDALLKSYGVGFSLVLLWLVCTFLGLRFFAALLTCLVLMVAWVIAAVITQGTLPGISSVLLAGAVMYLETCWNMENDARHDFIRFRKLYHERMSTHSFLTNMLPPHVFEGLKREDRALVAHERQDASLMFSDIVSFTNIASSLKPEDVVALLNVMFATFDALAIKHSVYKVETIGDAYVACTNVVELRGDHAKCLIEFALAISRATRSMYTPSNQQIVIRVGIYTGSVIAGVVGRKMPRYHLFGETMSLAELMEQKGVPGMVAIAQSTFAAIPPDCLADYDIKALDPVPHGDDLIARWTIEKARASGHGAIVGDANNAAKNRARANVRRSNPAIKSPTSTTATIQTNANAAQPPPTQPTRPIATNHNDSSPIVSVKPPLLSFEGVSSASAFPSNVVVATPPRRAKEPTSGTPGPAPSTPVFIPGATDDDAFIPK